MPYTNSTTTKRKFKHISSDIRANIQAFLSIGMPKAQIARKLGIARSTLYNELARGTVTQIDTHRKKYTKYFKEVGQRVYNEHRQNSRRPLKLMEAFEFVNFAQEAILKKKMSPDAICGQNKRTKVFEKTVCTKTLYNYIEKHLLDVINLDLPLKVKRTPKKAPKDEDLVKCGLSIEERPQEVNERTEFGHWEIDTIVGTKEKSAVLLVLDERMTRMRHIVKISSRSSTAVAEGLGKIKEIYKDCFSKIFKSITSDNGCEFVSLQEAVPETKIYYAHPYSSYERGTNEKQNSLVRRFFPKGKSFEKVSDEQIAYVENWINTLPRKILQYRTGKEFFQSVLFALAI